MMTLKAEKRDPQVKAKKLRREGFVTGVLYGKEMKENVALKFEEKEALRFMKDAKEGAQAALDIEGETVNAMVKNIDYDPMSKKVLALDFQALVAGEVVSATVPVHFLNEEIVQGVFEPELSEIHYKADPAHLLDPVEIDLAKLPMGTKNMYVKDLKLEEKGVNVSTPGDTQLFHIADFVKTDDDAEEADADASTDKKLLLKSDLSYKKKENMDIFVFLLFIILLILFFFTLKGHIPGFPDIIH